MLHIITVLFNYCEYKIRYQLAKEFIKRYQNFSPNMKLYVVELAYDDQEFQVTDKNNPCHLQLRSNTPLWHKENLINVGIKKLLPEDWEYVAWIDCNLEFENSDFVDKTLEKLQKYDVVQMYKTIIYSNNDKEGCLNSYIYNKINNKNNKNQPGGAFACTKYAYQTMGEIYDLGICGGGDSILSYGLYSINFMKNINFICFDFLVDIDQYIIKLKKLKKNYVDNKLIYFNHGNFKNRKYIIRHYILNKYCYNPERDIEYDENGVIVLKNEDMLRDIKEYFKGRNEDDDYKENIKISLKKKILKKLLNK